MSFCHILIYVHITFHINCSIKEQVSGKICVTVTNAMDFFFRYMKCVRYKRGILTNICEFLTLIDKLSVTVNEILL